MRCVLTSKSPEQVRPEYEVLGLAVVPVPPEACEVGFIPAILAGLFEYARSLRMEDKLNLTKVAQLISSVDLDAVARKKGEVAPSSELYGETVLQLALSASRIRGELREVFHSFAKLSGRRACVIIDLGFFPRGVLLVELAQLLSECEGELVVCADREMVECRVMTYLDSQFGPNKTQEWARRIVTAAFPEQKP